MNAPPRPPKRRRLRAPLEPGLPGVDPIADDPRSGLHKLRRRPAADADAAPHPRADAAKPRYAELHCLSNFSFQRGASSAIELFERAKKLGYAALAITDECSLAGIVRALQAAEETGVKLIVGSEVRLADGPRLVLLVANDDGYSDLCRLITAGRRRSAKGEYRLMRADAERLGNGVLVLWVPRGDATQDEEHAAWVARHFRGRAWLAIERHHDGEDVRFERLYALAARHALTPVAAGEVHMHVRRRRALQDVMTAIRLGCTVAEAGHALFPNGERHLRRVDDLAALYPPELLAETLRIAGRCDFDLRKLDYRYPHELVPAGLDAITHLRARTRDGAAKRWPGGVPASVRVQVEKELALIEKLGYEHFFLTVEEIVAWARAQDPPILCQGRGSSANSAVCYCLGITAVDPGNGNLLFERFLSEERNEPPDIDVDFEHERREEVIQHIFGKYGRERAALAATVISYRSKSAIRDVGRALGVPDDQLDVLSGMFSRIRSGQPFESVLRERGFDPSSRTLQKLFALAGELRGFPRHLSQHVGGFVISERPLHHLVPVENAAMPERTIIQWDKDDLEEMRLLKVDVLALGMLTCIRKCLDLLHAHGLWTHPYHGERPSLHDIPQGKDRGDGRIDAVYDMICEADTVGVFQIESRAQMSMLPRLRPRAFYDLVVEVAIVRPGPIQGDMVHPYLRRRKGQEAVSYPQSRSEREAGRGDSAVRAVLERTLGVPIFQEQVMKLIQVVAGFTPGEADQLRRAMAAWKRRGGLGHFRDRIHDGMIARGYEESYFERIFQQIQGFGEYGFPESHAASFALLAWASSWLKHHHPAAFTCALLNSQPMGFYQPSQLVQDARAHGVRVLSVDVTASEWDCSLEPLPKSAVAPAADAVGLRLGLRQVRGMTQELAERLVAARRCQPFVDVDDITRRAHLAPAERARLADAGALHALSGHRYRARWDSAGAEVPLPVLATAKVRERAVELREPSMREDVMTDYATLGLSLAAHPLALVRSELSRRRVSPAHVTKDAANRGRSLRCAGLVTVRQHPGTAKGVTFVTLEDETGIVNVVVWRALAERQHRVLLEATVMAVDGVLEASEGVHHLIAKRLYDYSPLLSELGFASRDFH
ncbi:error-prone DNA polymerase [Dokdonella sp.]|uniref:error-prone DNA polymerase n=1 Tax=Dokdonella sp. TaxID=2291710 RepID=UPI002F413A1A